MPPQEPGAAMPIASRPYATVDVFEADDVVFVEFAEGDLEDPRRPLTIAGEAVDRAPRDKEFLLGLGMEDLVAELDPGTGVENDPELVAVMVILARERAARLDGDDLDRAGDVVSILLESPPGLVYFYRRG